jgi:uncharacterized membrane protein (DUF485 family)
MTDTALGRLSRFSRRVCGGFALGAIVAYLALNLAVVYVPEWLATPVMAGGIVSWGILISLLGILAAILATAIYVRIVNSRGDALRQAAIEDQSK